MKNLFSPRCVWEKEKETEAIWSTESVLQGSEHLGSDLAKPNSNYVAKFALKLMKLAT